MNLYNYYRLQLFIQQLMQRDIFQFHGMWIFSLTGFFKFQVGLVVCYQLQSDFIFYGPVGFINLH